MGALLVLLIAIVWVFLAQQRAEAEAEKHGCLVGGVVSLLGSLSALAVIILTALWAAWAVQQQGGF